MDLAQGDGPGRWFVAAAAGGFVEAEGLEGSGEGEEEQGGCSEDAEVEVDQAGVLQERVGRRHYVLFLHKEMNSDNFSLIFLGFVGQLFTYVAGYGNSLR